MTALGWVGVGVFIGWACVVGGAWALCNAAAPKPAPPDDYADDDALDRAFRSAEILGYVTHPLMDAAAAELVAEAEAVTRNA